MEAPLKQSLIIDIARSTAIYYHGTQMYGDQPFIFHLDAVYRVLVEVLGIRDEVILIASYLHDIVEDTNMTQELMESRWSPEVAELVWRVTNEPGRNRKERNPKTYFKITASRKAVILKCADRFVNTAYSILANEGLYDMYREEYPEFRKALWLSEDPQKMWVILDSICL